ncbi:MAG: amidohydrolase family protein [Halobacteriales archaeon]
MDSPPDIVIRNTYLPTREPLVDVAVADGVIDDMFPSANVAAATEIDADGRLVSPGLVDAHVHLDMAFSAGRDRLPHYNDGPRDLAANIQATGDYFAGLSRPALETNVAEAARLAIANGVLHVRSHCYVDSIVGASVLEAVERVRERLSGVIDIQTVSFPQQGIAHDSGSLDALEAGLEAGADLVGGLDPATRNGDREGTIETWFDLAAEHDAGLDIHVHERGEEGMETLRALAAAATDRGLGGRTAASHAFGLADADGSTRNRAVESFQNVGLGLVTCYQSTPGSMPIRAFDEAGHGLAHGTDQVRTLWSPHGNADALQAMLVESLRLDLPATNDVLGALWRLITENGAAVLGIDSDYGIETGAAADLVVHAAASPQLAILTGATPAYVIKSGTVVAENGTVVDWPVDGG